MATPAFTAKLTLCLAATAWLACALAARPAAADEPDSLACTDAVAAANRVFSFPDGLLAAIATVESGRPADASGQRLPWPWTVTAEGVGHYYATKAEAIAAVIAMQERGIVSIDVGCLQVNLSYHPHAFTSLDEAFEPMANANYAGSFLASLFAQTADWLKAAAAYHSRTPDLAAAYEALVEAAWHGGAGLPMTVFGLPVAPDPAPAKTVVTLPTPILVRAQGVSFATGTLDDTWRPVPLPPPRTRKPRRLARH